MKKKIIFFTILFFAFFWSAAQKKLIDNYSWKNWPGAAVKYQNFDYDISPNGNFLWFSALGDSAKTTIAKSNGEILTILNEKLNKENCYFSPDSRQLIYVIHNKLKEFNFKSKKSSTLFDTNQNSRSSLYCIGKSIFFISYRSGEGLLIFNVEKKKLKRYKGISGNFRVLPQSNSLLISKDDHLGWLDVSFDRLTIFSEGGDKTMTDVVVSNDGKSAAFIINYDTLRKASIFFYNQREKDIRRVALIDTIGLPNGAKIAKNTFRFTPDNKHLYLEFYLPLHESFAISNKVKVWNWKKETYINEEGPVVIPSLIYLNQKYPQLVNFNQGHLTVQYSKTNLLVKSSYVRQFDYEWQTKYTPEFTLINLKNKKKISLNIIDRIAGVINQVHLSPDGRLIVWYDKQIDDYFAFDIATEKTYNLTSKINLPKDFVLQNEGSLASKWNSANGAFTWINENSSFLIADRYDLWQIDANCKKDPICLTGNFGRKNHINLMLAEDHFGENYLSITKNVLLKGLSEVTKDNGLWSISLGKINQLSLSHLQPMAISWNWLVQEQDFRNSDIVKSIQTSTYLLKCQSAIEAPNLYVTKDLENYTKLTNNAPQQDYNWMTAELITYPINRRGYGKAIVYKPENFNPNNKYPVIFNYYQERSSELHLFRFPTLFVANIDIAWYTSNGYVVVIPDVINNQPGKIAETTVSSIDGAVDFLSQNSWFDTKHMGAQGQSFGAYETNLLIANSKYRFAAACSMSGVSNLLSSYFGHAFGLDRSAVRFNETGQPNLNVTPWDNLQTYIDNSPVLQADKIQTPLLLIHNRSDLAVPFEQGQSMFFAMRRLKKPCWMLEYEDGNHALWDVEKSSLDAMNRIEQFFDYYLKGKPEPEWLRDIDIKTFQNLSTKEN